MKTNKHFNVIKIMYKTPADNSILSVGGSDVERIFFKIKIRKSAHPLHSLQI